MLILAWRNESARSLTGRQGTLQEPNPYRWLREAAQIKLIDSTVGVVGLGGLGSAACLYLAAAGVGRLIIADRQILEIANLGRQVLHWELDVTAFRTKVESASLKLRRLNSKVQTIKVAEEINDDNVDSIFHEADIMLDCTNDNSGHAVLNRYCVSKRMPLVFAAIEGFSGKITVVVPGRSPCLNCLSSELYPGMDNTRVIAAASGVFGTLQAIETIKLWTGYGTPLISRLLRGETGRNGWEIVDVSRREDCEVCGQLP